MSLATSWCTTILHEPSQGPTPGLRRHAALTLISILGTQLSLLVHRGCTKSHFQGHGGAQAFPRSVPWVYLRLCQRTVWRASEPRSNTRASG
jgi:hypothetical protein